ncbi:MAG: ISKra4 family transposase [Nitrospirae bacterium]|nr:ISKra4 family transposase [Nitrospirota bacterium]
METAFRETALSVAARLLEGALNRDLSDGEPRERPCSCGGIAGLRGRIEKTVQSILGPLRLSRAYYHCPACQAGFFPRDREIGVENTAYTPATLRKIGVVAALVSFEESEELLRSLAGLRIPAKQVERAAEALGTEMIADEQAVADPEPAPRPEVVYTGWDGTGVPMRPDEVAGRPGKQEDGSAKTREAKLCLTWTASQTDDRGVPVRDEGSVRYAGGILGAASRDTDAAPSDFAQLVLRESRRTGFDTARTQVILGDGAPWIWNIASEHFPNAVQIVDLFHAKEHLSTVAKAIFDPKTPEYACWVQARHDELEAGQTSALIAALSVYQSRFPEAQKCIGYLKTNQKRMDYLSFRARGFCVSSGVVEAGCKRIVGARLKRGGMHWSENGANAIIALRNYKLSGRFEAFFERRSQRRSLAA